MSDTNNSALKTKIVDAMKAAMRNKLQTELTAIRSITTAIKQIEVDERIILDDSRILSIIQKLIKQHRDSIAQFKNANRLDLVEKETKELGIIQQFLPPQLSTEQLIEIVTANVKKYNANSLKDMGKVMDPLKAELEGQADMSEVSKILKNLLSAES